MDNKILRTIEQIKEISKELGWNAEEVFTKGECGSLFHIMKALYGTEVSAYGLYLNGFDLQHILIYYKDVYYDINGEFTIIKFIEQFNQKVGYNVLKEENLLIGKQPLQLKQQCCGNYQVITGIPFDSKKEISKLFEKLKNSRGDLF